ncbi:hypothetical protein PQR63_17295 [Herbaspirillum rhizosphaerae]|uniref:Uncharacterized protein n=1 Tax=Herbaspirillum rhizosphaerae TaxID=346179 RepID=A0ABW8ZC96_9BURK
MKNQQKIVDNKIFQLSQQQRMLRIVVTRLMAMLSVAMLSQHCIALWCKQDKNRQFWCKHSPNCRESVYSLSTIIHAGMTPALHSVITRRSAVSSPQLVLLSH